MESGLETSSQTMFISMGIGVGVALIIILVALFQEPLVRATRASSELVVRSSRTIAGQVSRISIESPIPLLRRATRRVTSALKRLSEPRAPRPVRANLARSDETDPPLNVGPPTVREWSELVVVDERDDRDEVDENGLEPEVDQNRREPSLKKEYHVPASTILISEELRTFLKARDGAAPFETIVRHFDRTFGPGRGRGIIEAQRARGTIALMRDPDRPTQILAVLNVGDDGDPEPV